MKPKQPPPLPPLLLLLLSLLSTPTTAISVFVNPSPTGGDILVRGSRIRITWKTDNGPGGERDSLQLWAGPTSGSEIAANIVDLFDSSVGAHDWVVPDTLEPRDDYYMMLLETTGMSGIRSYSGRFAIVVEEEVEQEEESPVQESTSSSSLSSSTKASPTPTRAVGGDGGGNNPDGGDETDPEESGGGEDGDGEESTPPGGEEDLIDTETEERVRSTRSTEKMTETRTETMEITTTDAAGKPSTLVIVTTATSTVNVTPGGGDRFVEDNPQDGGNDEGQGGGGGGGGPSAALIGGVLGAVILVLLLVGLVFLGRRLGWWGGSDSSQAPLRQAKDNSPREKPEEKPAPAVMIEEQGTAQEDTRQLDHEPQFDNNLQKFTMAGAPLMVPFVAKLHAEPGYAPELAAGFVPGVNTQAAWNATYTPPPPLPQQQQPPQHPYNPPHPPPNTTPAPFTPQMRIRPQQPHHSPQEDQQNRPLYPSRPQHYPTAHASPQEDQQHRPVYPNHPQSHHASPQEELRQRPQYPSNPHYPQHAQAAPGPWTHAAPRPDSPVLSDTSSIRSEYRGVQMGGMPGSPVESRVGSPVVGGGGQRVRVRAVVESAPGAGMRG